MIASTSRRRLTRRMTGMIGQLRAQRGLDHAARELREHRPGR